MPEIIEHTQTLTDEDYREKYGPTPKDKLDRYKRRKRIRIFFLVVMLLCIVGISVYLCIIKQHEKKIASVKPDDIEISESDFGKNLGYYLIDGVQVQKGLKDLYLQNSDVRGWIHIPDTKIDYPVLQSNPENPEFYLYRDFDKSNYIGGSIFADAAADTVKPSENVILYGHHTSDGSGFKQIKKYEKESFYETHKTFWIKTLNGNCKYEVIAAYRTSTHDGDFRFWEYCDMDKTRFAEYVTACRQKSLYNTRAVVNYGDSLITLCTCAYHTYGGKFIVVAKRIGIQEIDTTKPPIATITTNEDGTYTEE